MLETCFLDPAGNQQIENEFQRPVFFDSLGLWLVILIFPDGQKIDFFKTVVPGLSRFQVAPGTEEESWPAYIGHYQRGFRLTTSPVQAGRAGTENLAKLIFGP